MFFYYDMNNEYERMKMKIDYFCRNSIPIHVTFLKNNKKAWLNGWIAKVTDDILTVDDYEDGIKDIFIVDIIDVVAFEPNHEKEEKDGGTN